MAMLTKVLTAAFKPAATRPRVAVRVASVVDARSFSSEAAGDDKKPRQQQQQRPPRRNNNNNNQNNKQSSTKNNNLLFSKNDGDKNKRTDRKFSFALKDKKDKQPRKTNNDNDKTDKDVTTNDEGKAASQPRKFAWGPSAKAKENVPELEKFDAPAYWNDDFPADFDDGMKHEVEKLEVFADFTMLFDESWQKEIHPLFDGSEIELILNAPLEDFDEHLFIDDKNTYDTKVVMHVPLTSFKGLTPAALEIVKQLAGPRYDANKKHLKLTEDRYPSRVHNHKRLCDILRDLTQSAHELSTAEQAQQAQE